MREKIQKQQHHFPRSKALFLTGAFVSMISPCFAAVTYNNASRSRAPAYQQLSAIKSGAYAGNNIATPPPGADVDVPSPIPIESDAQSANATRGDLEKCSMIFPNGSFAWAKPTAGMKVANRKATCVAYVELRQISGTEDIVLASANLAAGDVMDCNISAFPTDSYTVEAGQFTFPADREPTMDDVKKTMDAEQKKNAGMKIAAATVIGAIAGNATGKNDVGKSGIVGTDKDKMKNSAIGAIAGAAIMTGATQTGKVAGDIILSTGVNAAAGAVVGNMMATGSSVLHVVDCKDGEQDATCLWGVVQETGTLKAENNEVGFYNIDDNRTMLCTGKNEFGLTDCKITPLIGFTVCGKTVETLTASEKDFVCNGYKAWAYDPVSQTLKEGHNDSEGRFIEISGGGKPTKTTPAMIKILDKKELGKDAASWTKYKNGFGKKDRIFYRNSRGEIGREMTEYKINDFYPLYISPEDGDIIDLNNSARTKSTVIGAGIGGGLGAFTAYQGAQDEMDMRWVSAVQEYKDSLQKVYCATGTRFLSTYNDVVIIPNIRQ